MGWFYSNLLKIPQEHPTFGVHITMPNGGLAILQLFNHVQSNENTQNDTDNNVHVYNDTDDTK